MDFYEAKSKLLYVSELLEDIGHYHQTNLHACACDLCVQKQALLRSSITKALQEVKLVHRTLEQGKNGHLKEAEGSPVSNLNFSCNLFSTSGVPFGRDSMLVNKGDHSYSHLSPNVCANLQDHASGKLGQRNCAEQNGQAELTPSNADSGIHALSRSSSPAEAGSPPVQNLDLKCSLPRKGLDAEGASPESTGRHQTVFSTASLTSTSTSANAQVLISAVENLSTNRKSKSPSNVQISSNQFDNPDVAHTLSHTSCIHKVQELNPPPEKLLWPSQNSYPSSESPRNLTVPPNPWMGNLLPPFPLMSLLPTPSIVHELNRRYSEIFMQNSPTGNQDDRRNQTFSYYGHPHLPLLSNANSPHSTTQLSHFSTGTCFEQTPPTLVTQTAEFTEQPNSLLNKQNSPFGTQLQDEKHEGLIPNIDRHPGNSEDQSVTAASIPFDLKDSPMNEQSVKPKRLSSSTRKNPLHNNQSSMTMANATPNLKSPDLTTGRLSENFSNLRLGKADASPKPNCCKEQSDLRVDSGEKTGTQNSCGDQQSSISRCKDDTRTTVEMTQGLVKSLICDNGTDVAIDKSGADVDENDMTQDFSDSDSMVWRPWESKNDISKLVSLNLDTDEGSQYDTNVRSRKTNLDPDPRDRVELSLHTHGQVSKIQVSGVQYSEDKSSAMTKDQDIGNRSNLVSLDAQENKLKIGGKFETTVHRNFNATGDYHGDEDSASTHQQTQNPIDKKNVLPQGKRSSKRLEYDSSNFRPFEGNDKLTKGHENVLKAKVSPTHRKDSESELVKNKTEPEGKKENVENKARLSLNNSWKDTKNSVRRRETDSESGGLNSPIENDQNVQFTEAENEQKTANNGVASDLVSTSLKCLSNLETSNKKSLALNPERKTSVSTPLKRDTDNIIRVNNKGITDEDKENEKLQLNISDVRSPVGRTNFTITNLNVSSEFIATELGIVQQVRNQSDSDVLSNGTSGTVTMTPPHKQMQWGAPAVMAGRYGSNNVCQPKTLNVQSECKDGKNTHWHKANSDVPGQSLKQLSSGTLSDAESLRHSYAIDTVLRNIDPVSTPVSSKQKSLLASDLKNESGKITPNNVSATANSDITAWVVPKNVSVIRDRNKLNQSLPSACSSTTKTSHEQSANPPLINESYEANQSFPKMAKPQQTETCVADTKHKAGFGGTAAEKNLVTDLHQISTPAHRQPRNRRSVFGFSPPDPHQSQKFKDNGQVTIGHADVSLIESKSFSDPNDPGYMDTLWSVLDISLDIGHQPTVQEVLFNSVTSSICVVDPSRNGKIISVNESFQFLIGVHEKVVGQRLFRFIKVKTSLDDLGLALPQSFVLSDGRMASVSGKLVSCIDARGEETTVTIWTVPYSPQPKLTLCVIGVSLVPVVAEIYLNREGKVLMYTESFEDIIGLTKKKCRDSAEGVCQISGLDFSKISIPQHTFIPTRDGCLVPAAVTLSDNQDTSQNSDKQGEDRSMGPIYPAILSVSANVSGLMTVQSDGLIRSCDQNFFRINLGYSSLPRKHHLSEFLSEVVKISQGSSQSSANSSPSDGEGKNPGVLTSLGNVSRLGEDDKIDNMRRKDSESESCSLFLPSLCFSKQDILSLDDDEDDEECDEDDGNDETIDTDSEAEVTEEMSVPSECLPLAPHQTSTPCKKDWGQGVLSRSCRVSRPKVEATRMENGIYAALFLHEKGHEIPVTFKLSRIQPLGKDTLFCLWFYIQPDSQDDDENEDEEEGDSDESNDEVDDERDDEDVSGEGDLRRRLRHLNFDRSVDNNVEPSLGQLILDQAALNQSHNAASSEDMLDLETAIAGKFSKEYIVHETLGQGSFGFVRRATVCGSNQSVVVKFIKKSKMFDDSWVADTKKSKGKIPLEVAILRETDSDYVIKLLDVYDNEAFVQMVMEDFGDVDLFDFIDQVDIDEPLACFLFRQIIWAVDYLHSMRIIHRDIKDENVIISSNFRCKLIDFGSAAYLPTKGEFFTAFRGTTEYCSPEVYNGQSYRGPELDIWALGVTLYTIVFRENPFAVTDMPEAFAHLDFPQTVSEDFLELISGLLETNPASRLKMNQALASDWLPQIVDISNYDWEEMMGDPQRQMENVVDVVGRGSGHTFSE